MRRQNVFVLLEAELEKKRRPDELEEDGNEVVALKEELMKMCGIFNFWNAKEMEVGRLGE